MGRPLAEVLDRVRVDALPFATPPTVHPTTPLSEVHRRLAEERPGAVLIVGENGLAGIFTERDVLYRTALGEHDPATPIGELMTRQPVTLALAARVAEAIRRMIEGGYRNLPLVDADGRAVGVLSSRTILAFIGEHFPEAVLNLPPRLHQQMVRPEGG